MLVSVPSHLREDEALSLIDSLIQQSQAEAVFIRLSCRQSALSRFCENQISQNVNRDRLNLTVTSYFGTQSASASTTDLTPEALNQTLRRSEELARFAPEDPEWVPLLESQTYEQYLPVFDQETSLFSPLEQGKLVQRICTLSRSAGVEASGTLSRDVSCLALGNSAGLRAYTRETEANFSLTARIEDGSSWSEKTAFAIGQLPIEETTHKVIERAKQSRNPRIIEPGTYPVIFEAAAFASLLPWVIWNLDARAADEGRSFMSRLDQTGKPIGNRVGESLFSPLVQIQRNPTHPLLQSSPFFRDGFPNNCLDIIKDGIPKTLSYSRYWAQQTKQQPTGYLFPVVMEGSSQNISDLVAQTERGIFVSRAWYVRYVNPRILEVTGMTRDGTFWIENGKLAYPIKNLRFNQSLPEMLQNLDGLSTVERFSSGVIPGVRVKEFHFSSMTDSV